MYHSISTGMTYLLTLLKSPIIGTESVICEIEMSGYSAASIALGLNIAVLTRRLTQTIFEEMLEYSDPELLLLSNH